VVIRDEAILAQRMLRVRERKGNTRLLYQTDPFTTARRRLPAIEHPMSRPHYLWCRDGRGSISEARIFV